MLFTMLSTVVLAAAPAHAGNGALNAIFSPAKQFKCPDGTKSAKCPGIFTPSYARSNEVALLTSADSLGGQSLQARLDSIRNAKKSIRIQALIFTGDETGIHITEALKKKKKENRKIDIRIVVDAISNLEPQTQWMYFDLKQHGIEVEGYEAGYLTWINDFDPADPLKSDRRHHDKMWIVDGEDVEEGLAIVGGLNIANEYFRIGGKKIDKIWRDQDIIVRGPVITDIVEAFDRDYAFFKSIKSSKPKLFGQDLLNTDKWWKKSRKLMKLIGNLEIGDYRSTLVDDEGLPLMKYSKDDDYLKQLDQVNAQSHGYIKKLEWFNADMRFIQARPRFGETYIHNTYLELIDAAEKEILIANAYFIPEDDTIAALKRAAARGVKVTILTNSYETNDSREMAMVTRSLYKTLFDTKGQLDIWEWNGDKDRFGHRREGTIHAKFAVFDREVSVVGSYNLDSRSQNLNSETVMVYNNEKAAQRLVDQFFAKDLKKATYITRADAEHFVDTKKMTQKQRIRYQLSLKLKKEF